MPTTIRLTDELASRIKKLAAQTGRSQSFYINQMIEREIDTMEQVYGILHETEQYQAGTLETYSSDDLRRELGVAPASAATPQLRTLLVDGMNPGPGSEMNEEYFDRMRDRVREAGSV